MNSINQCNALVLEYTSFAMQNLCILTQSTQSLDNWIPITNTEPFHFSFVVWIINYFPQKSTICVVNCTCRQYLSMLQLRLYMIELFTKLALQELTMCTLHRTLVDRIYVCNIAVVLFPNHWMITAPCYRIIHFNDKSWQKR